MFKNLPKANDAAIRVLSGQYEKAEQQAAKVESAITRAISSGERGVNIDGSLEGSVQAKLRSMGYTVNYNNDQRDGNYTSITW